MPIATDTIAHSIATLNRPKLLVRAATIAMAEYQRRRDLRRMLRVAIPATPTAALQKLIPIEADLERRRIGDGRSYSLARHVDILAALMAEAHAFNAERRSAPTLPQRTSRRAVERGSDQAAAAARSALRLVTNSSNAPRVASSMGGAA
ncbi:DUF6477 family protein [Jannaschia sp. LMIT008]|uniref:DUF6477 family protein n=1 Tax=Jannaschia maritima TaxID=3032585 RepID=UPI002811ABC8|nr:DUF6477 family protein [Jannaschia sp. LMIT008]